MADDAESARRRRLVDAGRAVRIIGIGAGRGPAMQRVGSKRERIGDIDIAEVKAVRPDAVRSNSHRRDDAIRKVQP